MGERPWGRPCVSLGLCNADHETADHEPPRADSGALTSGCCRSLLFGGSLAAAGPCATVPNTKWSGKEVVEDLYGNDASASAQDCCTRCRNKPDCEVWAWCDSNPASK